MLKQLCHYYTSWQRQIRNITNHLGKQQTQSANEKNQSFNQLIHNSTINQPINQPINKSWFTNYPSSKQAVNRSDNLLAACRMLLPDVCGRWAPAAIWQQVAGNTRLAHCRTDCLVDRFIISQSIVPTIASQLTWICYTISQTSWKRTPQQNNQIRPAIDQQQSSNPQTVNWSIINGAANTQSTKHLASH